MTINEEQIWICVDNQYQVPVVIDFIIQPSSKNNDTTRIADVNHLAQYDQAIKRLNKVNQTIEELAKNNQLYYNENIDYSSYLLDFLTKMTIFSVFFILFIKFLEMQIIRKRLRDKKLL